MNVLLKNEVWLNALKIFLNVINKLIFLVYYFFADTFKISLKKLIFWESLNNNS